MFDFSKQPENPQTTVIQATFTNLSPNRYTDFVFLAAVPKVATDSSCTYYILFSVIFGNLLTCE